METKGFSFPKIELHRHLEGSIRQTTYFELAKEQGLIPREMTLEELIPAIQYMEGDVRTLPAGLKKMEPIRYIIKNPEILARVVYEAFEDAVLEGCVYTEIRFSSTHMFLQGMTEKEIADGAYEGLCMAKRKLHTGGCLIAGITREKANDFADRITTFAINNQDKGIYGMDLFGDERVAPEESKAYFDRAYDAGMRITIHAGESGGADNIRTAINMLHAERIGHGTHLFEKNSVVDLIREKKILIESCPSSNVQTGAVEVIEEHPLKKYFENDIPCAICTDDPRFMGLNMDSEYSVAEKILGVTEEEIKQSLRITADYIFDRDYIPVLKKELA